MQDPHYAVAVVFDDYFAERGVKGYPGEVYQGDIIGDAFVVNLWTIV